MELSIVLIGVVVVSVVGFLVLCAAIAIIKRDH